MYPINYHVRCCFVIVNSVLTDNFNEKKPTQLNDSCPSLMWKKIREFTFGIYLVLLMDTSHLKATDYNSMWNNIGRYFEARLIVNRMNRNDSCMNPHFLSPSNHLLKGKQVFHLNKQQS